MPTDLNSSTEPEYLGDAPTSSPRPKKGLRGPVMGLAALGVVGVVAVGGWAAMSLMSGGTQPAEAIPANAIGYVSLDLDPSAAQKIEAFKILRKFPAINKEMKVSSEDDLRRWVFKQIQKDGQCNDVDYDKDIAPWIGDRIAMAGLPAEKAGASPTPLVALQVTDHDAASKGIKKLADCSHAGKGFGFAFTGDYAVISDSQQHAQSSATAAGKAPLADDADYQSWMHRVGDPGIITAYAAPGAMDALVDMQAGVADRFAGAGGTSDKALLRSEADMARTNQHLKDLYKGFKGMAAVVRFKQGAVEAQFAGDSKPGNLGLKFSPTDRADIAHLPSGTGAAFALSLPKGWGQAYLDLMGKMTGGAMPMDEMLKQAEAQTGLDLPGDIEQLLGNGVAVSVSKDLDVKAASQDPTGIPAGIRISGDPAQIRAAVDKVKKAIGPEARSLAVEEGDGVVALGLDQKYVHDLSGRGGLGDEATFQDVVPKADRATAAFYVNFDAVETWIAEGMNASAQPKAEQAKVLDNIKPLRALGMSSWVEDDGTQAGLLRLSTD